MKATRAVMEVLGCHPGPYRFFRQEGVHYPDVICQHHGNVWDVERDLCEVAEEASHAALKAGE